MVAIFGGDLGERGGDVEFGDGGGGGAYALRVPGGAFTDIGEELSFEGEDLVLGVQDFAWVGPAQLAGYSFPAADERLLKKLLDSPEWWR